MKLNGSILRAVLCGIAAGGLLAGCGGSGDIKIAPVTTDSSTDNSVNNSNNVAAPVANPCASNGEIQGDFEAPHCMYSTAFADSGNNITTDMTLVELDDDGAHVFNGSLFIGNDYTKEDLAAAGIAKGGDGPKLTIEAGATLAFLDKSKFMVIMRGSTISAVGTAAKPITITSLSDVNGTLASPEAYSQWGGMVVNGFAVTNKCSYTGTRGATDFALEAGAYCDIPSEGSLGQDANHYGGTNDEDNSGRMEYVIVKHTGAEVANNDELNGITFSGVGSATVLKNMQAYSTYDDGFEFFGGSVNMENAVLVYVADDSLDFDEGYNGTITNALIIQAETTGNQCIESDGIGSYKNAEAADLARNADFVTRKLNSAPTVLNMTCIYSPNEGKNGVAPHSSGAGLRFREGIAPTIKNALVIGTGLAEGDTGNNWAIRIESDESASAFTAGTASITGSVFAALDKSKGTIGTADVDAFLALAANGSSVFADVTTVPLDATATADTGLVLLEGTPPIYSVDAATSTPVGAPVISDPDATEAPAFTGALSAGATTDWASWAYGIYEGNRGQALWFE